MVREPRPVLNQKAVDAVLDSVLAQDSCESDFDEQIKQGGAELRAIKCRSIASNFFKGRNMRVTTSDLRALSLLLFKVTLFGNNKPGRPRTRVSLHNIADGTKVSKI